MPHLLQGLTKSVRQIWVAHDGLTVSSVVSSVIAWTVAFRFRGYVLNLRLARSRTWLSAACIGLGPTDRWFFPLPPRLGCIACCHSTRPCASGTDRGEQAGPTTAG